MVVCLNCQHDSTDPLFCDRCNGLLPAPSATALPTCLTLRNGEQVDCSEWHGTWPADCWRPLTVAGPRSGYRLYALNQTWWRELAPRVQERAAASLGVLSPLEIHLIDDGAIVVAAGLPGAHHPLALVAEGDEWLRLEETLRACHFLHDALQPLHEAGLVWLNFDPNALEVNGSATQLSNVDLQLFHAGTCPDSLRLSVAYSPPEVCGFRADRIGPATDVFHVSLHLYYRLAGLLPGGFPGHGLESFDFDVPPLRIYCPQLPVGIARVIARGLARDPVQRFGTVAELTSALEDAINRAQRRQASVEPVAWEYASATVIGRSHEVQGLPNQDAHAVAPLADQLLCIVADGVTHARVGSGEVASQAAVEVLGYLLPLLLRHARQESELVDALCQSFVEASRTILELAQQAVPPEGCDPADMMSSTALVGVAAGNVLTLASAGDSRAYLVRDGSAEQLTVDGDVRCTQLAAGWAPEEVRDLGAEASALYTCLGVGEVTAGALEVSLPRSQPHLTRLALLPGDIIVLCTDGLVEEGAFLEPHELPLLLEPAGQSVSEMASRLVAAARARHRDPSVWEPAGCGDDITCVVLRIRSASEPDSARSGA